MKPLPSLQVYGKAVSQGKGPILLQEDRQGVQHVHGVSGEAILLKLQHCAG